jgi:hypothetical protein
MDNTNIDKLTKKLMAESNLKLINPIFDDTVMKKILLESQKLKNQKKLLLNFLIFTGTELAVLALMLVLLLYFPGLDFFVSSIKNSMEIFHTIGKLAIDYDYLIISSIVVFVLDRVINKTARVSLKF